MKASITIALAISCVWTSAAPGIEPTTQKFEFNVFLRDWQLLGPFPAPAGPVPELRTEFVENESSLRGGSVRFFKNKLFTWVPFKSGAINFRPPLKAPGSANDNKAAYAYTEVFCEQAQDVTMAFIHDDALAAWVNGVEVCRAAEETAALLDHTLADVSLKQGINRVLMKVTNSWGTWRGAARFRPKGMTEPLIEFGTKPTLAYGYQPTVMVTLLNKQSKEIAKYRVDAIGRDQSGKGRTYELYGTPPSQTPATVVFSVRAEGLMPTTVTKKWSAVGKGNVKVPLQADKPVNLIVVNEETNRPIEGAEIWMQSGVSTGVFTGAKGEAVVPNVPPGASQCWAVAKGHAAKSLKLKWPRAGIERLALPPGGRTLKGVITSTDGKPLANATVASGLSSGYAPTAVTDERGQFELFGLPDDRDRLYPTVVCNGYVAKDGFRQELSQKVTEVQWSLQTGAMISGRVTQKETGKPLPGIEIITGDNRYSSNVKNPKATTDQDGRYVLTGVDPGLNQVHAFSDNHAPEMAGVTVLVGGRAEQNFEMKAGKSVTGVITDSDGKPIPQVWLVTEEWNGARMFRREARTDADGRYELTHMPDIKADLSILKKGYISHRDVAMKGGDVLDLTMKPEIIHTVNVRAAATGSVVPNIQISKGYQWNEGRDYSWSNSQYDITRNYDQLAGTLRIEIDEPMNSPIAYRFRATGFREEILKVPTNTDVARTFDIELQPTRTFTARVVDADTGKPLPGIAVAVVTRGDRMRYDHYVEFQSAWTHLQENRFSGEHTTTDANGVFRLTDSSADGKFDFVLLNRDGAFVFIDNGQQFSALKSPDGAKDVPLFDLPFPKAAALRGTLTVAGKPVADTLVRLQWLDHGRPRSRNDGDITFGIGGCVHTNARGEFDFGQLGPGKYRIQRVFAYERPDGGSSSMYLAGKDIELHSGQTLTHSIEEPAGLTLAGHTLDSTGKPLPSCIVSVIGTQNSLPVAAMKSDATGKFSFEHLPAATYRIRAVHYVARERYSSTTSASATLSVGLTADKTDLDVTLQSTAGSTASRSRLTGTLPPHFEATPQGASAPFSIAQQAGKVTAICFWSPWSDDITAIDTAYRMYQDNDDVVFVTVFVGHTSDEPEKVIAKHGYQFPVISQQLNDPDSLAQVFGPWSSQGCFVIGRNGLFAAESTDGSAVTAAIAGALKEVKPPQIRKHARLLKLALTADGRSSGVAGANVAFKVLDVDNDVVHEDKYNLPGIVRDINWNYPAIPDGGMITVTVTGRGIREQIHRLKNPKTNEVLSIKVDSPRKITGRVVSMDDKDVPIAGMNVRLQTSNIGAVHGLTDAHGQFSIPCFPGNYYATQISNDQFVVPQQQPVLVNVSNDVDPEPLTLQAAPAISISGIVAGIDDKGAEDVQVMLAAGNRTTTDADGKFQLSGVPSKGKARLWAMKGGVYGTVTLNNPAANESIRIKLGETPDEWSSDDQIAANNSELPAIELWELDGKQTQWEPKAAKPRLIVVGALWQPNTVVLLQNAGTWASENSTTLEVISLDWTLAQARRESAQLGLKCRVLFAGQNESKLRSEWWLKDEPTAVLIDSAGTLGETPF